MGLKVLAINPGSTSTKIAWYDDEEEVFNKTIHHSIEELDRFDSITDQFDMRTDAIVSVLKKEGLDPSSLNGVVGRGGILPPLKHGAYKVNKAMLDRLRNNPIAPHASNLGALIANAIAGPQGIGAYIYDCVSVDEMDDVARISGMPEIPRISLSHALNSRAMAIKVAEKYDRSYEDMNFIVAHLGGGISLTAHRKGKMVDLVSDDEGPFSPERAGRVPCKKLIDLCYSGQYDKKTMQKKLRGKGGFAAYFGINDTKTIETMVKEGDIKAKLHFEAMGYQIAKGIGELATVLKGQVDAIVITGGIAFSDYLMDYIKERVSFIGPVEVMPGEKELESLAYGTLRVLRGQEKARVYQE